MHYAFVLYDTKAYNPRLSTYVSMTTSRKSLADNPSPNSKGNQRNSRIKEVMANLPARSKDNFLLLILFVMGLSGFAYILTVPVGNKLNRSSLFDKIFNAKEGKAITANFIKSNLVSIDGDLIANSPLQFNFQGLSEENDYEINFGDKIVSPIDSELLLHSYESAGTYKLEMRKISRGHTFVVHCEYIIIE